MLLSTVCPASAGSVLIRDVRAWHGGTPNFSKEVRAIPNIEVYAPWFHCPMPRFMPRGVYDTLSARGKRLCRYIVSDMVSDDALHAGYDVKGAPRL
jgi:hypothetical protein